MEYLKDFLNAQMEMRNVEKTARNDFGNYNYSTIDGIINSIKKPLNDNGFIISQHLYINSEKQQCLITEFIHTSGNKLSSSIALDLGELDSKKNRAQCMGALITYYRKYSLLCLAGIANGENDDDAEALTPDRHISTAEVKDLIKRIGTYDGLLADVLALNGVIDIKFISPDKLAPTIAFIDKVIKNKYEVKPSELDDLPLTEEQCKDLNILLSFDTNKKIYDRLLKKYEANSLKEIPQSKFELIKDWLKDLEEKARNKK
jgi:hypothetical protein